MAASTFMTSGWSAQPSSSSPWNSGILLDVPTILNQYPPGLGYGAWRAASSKTSSYPSSYDLTVPTGSKRSRPPIIRSTRRAPPPPTTHSRAQPVSLLSVQSSEDPFADPSITPAMQTDHAIVLYKSPSPSPARTRLASRSQSQSAGHSYPMHQYQSADVLAAKRAAADKEARLKVVASILLNRVNVVGKPMRKRVRNIGADCAPKAYVPSGLGRCIVVAE